ncbi:hypothetical protein VSDG_07346 [Cytospora chrysosperma]|uniref:Cytochrome P450 n=1 Tax=Cytospora chrysosperma TaxID=252740 RepID=A0A423VQC1_CYTCH|nr:hypothetical protein VSDG_07346 [Valsa sordida]
MALIRTYSTLPDTAQGCVPYFVAATVLYPSWRLWRFTIEPALNPTAPKPFPYLLPFLGHVVPMSNNSSKVFTRGREYFGDTREVFSLTVMGEDMYIVTSPTDVLSVYRETKKLDFDGFVKEIMKDFGCTEDTVTKMFDADFLEKINDMLRWDRISGQSVKTFTENSKTVSLWKWCGEVLVHAATKTFFGEAIYRVAPYVVSDFFTFDDNVDQFDPRRFLNDKSLLRSTSWRSFGGASTHCPGRFLARREVYMFVAIVLFRFDIKVVPAPREETPRFPRVDEAIPAGGLLPPVAGDDVFVEVRCARV